MPHRRTSRRPVLAAAATCAVLLLAGCAHRGLEDLVGTDLFPLEFGRLADQVDLFQVDGAAAPARTRVSMRDGWVYVANGTAGKVMVFTSYGDLLLLLYNASTNPPPVGLVPESAAAGAADAEATRGAVAWPFVDIGEIAVASDRMLYVEDQAADAKAVKDTARGMMHDRVVLRFDRRGRSLGWIGQEGIGGTPFPYIAGLHVTAADQLVVVCRLPDYSWEVSWFSRDAALLFKVVIDAAHLPILRTKDAEPSLITIVPDATAQKLLLVVHVASRSGGSISPDAPDTVSQRLYRLDLRTRAYEDTWVEFPRNPPRRERVQLRTTEIPSPPSDFLGMSQAGLFYLLAATDTNLYTLQVVDAAGRLRATRRLVIEDSELTFRDLHLSPGGLIYGLFADRAKARVRWWRSDLVPTGSAP